MARPKPRRFSPGVAIAACAVLAMLAVLLLSVQGPRAAVIGGPFELVASDGRVVTDRSFRGRYMLVYFGYTGCEDVCPMTLGSVAAALDLLGPRADRVQPLFVTVDPARDTPEVLGAYVALFSPRLLGLTGTAGQLQAAEAAYRVTSGVHPGGTGMIDHSSVLYLLGPDGRFLVPIRADESGTAMAAVLARFVS